jgi:prepilin-type N-terminal cleavage/methylation domain-containing protein
MKKQKAFTLLEILISMALSSFIIFGFMQSYQNLMKYLERARGMIQTNRKLCLLFHQFERDITSAFIQLPHEEIKPAKEESALEKAKKEREEKNKKDKTKIEQTQRRTG